MKRKQLKVLGLSYSQSQIGSYILVLGEKKGIRKLPIVIKPAEAQQIAIKIEGIKPARPLTHDLFKSLTDSFNLDIQEVFIYSLAEGIFYAKLISTNGLDEVEIDCGIGDAVAIALTYKCPIWVKADILDAAGIALNDDGSDIEDDNEKDDNEEDDFYETPTKSTSVNDLEHLMKNAIENEEYEIAASIRDRIQKLKDGQL
jgi:bifunctional DNase/RNase